MLLAAWAPGVPLLWLIVFRRRFELAAEIVWVAILVGACSGILAAGLGLATGPVFAAVRDPLGHAIARGAMVGLCEEGAKLLVLWCVVVRHWEFRDATQALPLAAAIGIGMALLENLFYVTAAGDWRVTAAMRALFSVPMHTLLGVLMGYLAARSLLVERPGRRTWIALAWLAPAALHAAYDAPLFHAARLVSAGEDLPASAALTVVVLVATLVIGIACARDLSARAARPLVDGSAAAGDPPTRVA